MHVRGDFIYWCDDYNGNVPGARELANKLRKNCGFDLQGPSRLKNLGGGFENWFRDEYDRPGFCIELIDINRTKFIKDGNFERITEWPESKYTFIQGMLK